MPGKRSEGCDLADQYGAAGMFHSDEFDAGQAGIARSQFAVFAGGVVAAVEDVTRIIETRNPKPETRNPKPGTWNLEFETSPVLFPFASFWRAVVILAE